MIKFLIIFICIFLYKLLLNISNFYKCKKFKAGYYKWINGNHQNYPTYKSEVLNLLKKAGVKDSKIPVAQPLGAGKLTTCNVSVMDNFPLPYNQHVFSTNSMFDEAVGTYRLRIKECFSIFYWIELIVFFPKHILLYININSEQFIFKILNVLFTFIWWSINVCLTIFNSQIKNFIIEVVKHMP